MDILAYCLMPTHYHVLARVKQPQTQTSEVSGVKRTTSEILKGDPLYPPPMWRSLGEAAPAELAYLGQAALLQQLKNRIVAIKSLSPLTEAALGKPW